MSTKIILAVVMTASFVCKLEGRTNLKANAAYWLVGITNMSVETQLSPRFTFELDAVYSPWKSVNGNHAQICQLISEVRFYPEGSFEKFYAGGYAAYHFFNITKWNYLNRGLYQKGRGWSLGILIGYQAAISEKWSLDIYAGGGYQNSGYRGYATGTGERYIGWNRSGEWLPYMLGAAFAYRIGSKNSTE